MVSHRSGRLSSISELGETGRFSIAQSLTIRCVVGGVRYGESGKFSRGYNSNANLRTSIARYDHQSGLNAAFFRSPDRQA
jgi:hypothetical protein